MPNTLTHIGVNGFLSKKLFKDSDLLWIYTGCLIPDFPWITMRIVNLFFGGLNGYDVKVYSIAQASLFMCFILSAAISFLGKKPARIFIILSIGSLLHLLLDALQIKWANGVNLLAPLNWELTGFNLFWPENPITYILTLSGILFFALNWKNITKIGPPFEFRPKQLLLSILLIIVYFLLPLLMMGSIERNDLHYLTTLREYGERKGKYVELDRKQCLFNEETNSLWINAYDGQIIELSNIPIKESSRLSVKGKFIDNDLIDVSEYHENNAIFRDGASYFGIFLIGLIWIIVIIRVYFT